MDTVIDYEQTLRNFFTEILDGMDFDDVDKFGVFAKFFVELVNRKLNDDSILNFIKDFTTKNMNKRVYGFKYNNFINDYTKALKSVLTDSYQPKEKEDEITFEKFLKKYDSDVSKPHQNLSKIIREDDEYYPEHQRLSLLVSNEILANVNVSKYTAFQDLVHTQLTNRFQSGEDYRVPLESFKSYFDKEESFRTLEETFSLIELTNSKNKISYLRNAVLRTMDANYGVLFVEKKIYEELKRQIDEKKKNLSLVVDDKSRYYYINEELLETMKRSTPTPTTETKTNIPDMAIMSKDSLLYFPLEETEKLAYDNNAKSQL
jgi:hypothetical protein